MPTPSLRAGRGDSDVEQRKLDFSLFLSCNCPESKASTAQVYSEMLDMAQAAERIAAFVAKLEA